MKVDQGFLEMTGHERDEVLCKTVYDIDVRREADRRDLAKERLGPRGIQNARTRVFANEAEARRAFPGAVFGRAEPGSAMARNAANLTSRVYVSLYHNWYLKDAVTLRGGLPALDLLDGGAVDFGGGRRRHEIEFQAGTFKSGLGARARPHGGAAPRSADRVARRTTSASAMSRR